jgi:hypothetical protein
MYTDLRLNVSRVIRGFFLLCDLKSSMILHGMVLVNSQIRYISNTGQITEEIPGGHMSTFEAGSRFEIAETVIDGPVRALWSNPVISSIV